MEHHRDNLVRLKAQQNRQAAGICEAVSLLSSVVQTERISADHQTGDCEQDIEKINIRHTHHLRFCILLRRLHPVDLLAYEMIIACT